MDFQTEFTVAVTRKIDRALELSDDGKLTQESAWTAVRPIVEEFAERVASFVRPSPPADEFARTAIFCIRATGIPFGSKESALCKQIFEAQ